MDTNIIEFQVINDRVQWRIVGNVDWKDLTGNDGRAVELNTSATHIQWRLKGDNKWNDLVPLANIVGPQGLQGNPGINGREVEMQVSSTHIQWRLKGDAQWINLIALSKLIQTVDGSNPIIGSSAGEEFLNRISALGEENILGFSFDNDARRIFTDPEKRFSVAKHYDSTTECLVFEEEDTRGTPYKVYVPVDTVAAIFVTEPENIGRIPTRFIAG